MKETQKDSEKKLTGEIAKALDSCAEVLSLNEFARVTGVRLELLRRFVNERTRRVRSDTWDKIYPTLKPYITGPEPESLPPARIGPPYRRHAELVGMTSDQKVLLDGFAVLPEAVQRRVIADVSARSGKYANATEFKSLSVMENQLMGAFLALDEDGRSEELLRLLRLAIDEVRRRRRELF